MLIGSRGNFCTGAAVARDLFPQMTRGAVRRPSPLPGALATLAFSACARAAHCRPCHHCNAAAVADLGVKC
jgi:hypothetical protein